MSEPTGIIEAADWPTFGWEEDIRPALAEAAVAGRPVALATLYRVEGSAPRGPGTQMLFDGSKAVGYFSGDCIEGDVANHAAQVIADGKPRHLHYGLGSPWIDIRLRCGGALYVFVERVYAGDPAVAALLGHAERRETCIWSSNGLQREVRAGDGPILSLQDEPFQFSRRYDPLLRIIVSGGDPGALALARMGSLSGFETVLVRPDGPESPPPFPVSRYLRCEPSEALAELGVDEWTAYVGATHEDHHDLGGCLRALREGAAYVGMIGAKSRSQGRLAALRAAGATEAELERLHLTPGLRELGKAPWPVATGILAQIMTAFSSKQQRP